MQFMEAVDYGNAPEFAIGGVVSIERISHGQIRVTYCNVYRNENRRENRVVLHHVWDIAVWMHFAGACGDLRTIIQSEPMLADAPDLARH